MSQNDFLNGLQPSLGDNLNGRQIQKMELPGEEGYYVSGYSEDLDFFFVARTDLYGNPIWLNQYPGNYYGRIAMEVDDGNTYDVIVAVRNDADVYAYRFEPDGSLAQPNWPVFVAPNSEPAAVRPIDGSGDFGILSAEMVNDFLYLTRLEPTGIDIFNSRIEAFGISRNTLTASFLHKDNFGGNILVTYGMSADYSAIASLEVDPGSGSVLGAPSVMYQELLTPGGRFAQIDVHDVKETPQMGSATGPYNYIVSGAINNIPFTAKMDNNFIIDFAVQISRTYKGEFNHMVYQEHLGGNTARALILSYFDPFDQAIPYVFEYDFNAGNLINMTLTELISPGAPLSGWSHFPASFAETPSNDPVLTTNTYDASQGLPIIAFDGMNLTGGCVFNQPTPDIDGLFLADIHSRDITYNPIGVFNPPFNSEPNPPIPMFSCNNPCPAPITASITPSNCLGGTPAMQLTASTSATNPNYLWIPGGQQTQSINITTPGTYTVVVSEPGTGCSETATFQADFLQVTVTVDNDEECDGICDAQVTANPTGGTPPYTYLWTFGGATTQTVSNLCNNIGGFGTPDNVTVTDANGCTVQSAPVSIGTNQPGPGFSYTSNITDASCFGSCDGESEFILTPPPGTVPGNSYSFDWNDFNTDGPIRDEMCDGSYTVTITHSNSQGDCELTENVTINYNNPSDWHKQSTSIGGNYDAVVNDVENDMEHVYVYGTFENQTVIDGVNINSGNGQPGVYVVKYDRCGTMEWIGHTDATGFNVGFKAVDIEYRYNELHLLFHNDNALPVFQQPSFRIKDNTGTDILNPGGTPIPGALFNVAPALSDGEYVIGSINNAGTSAQLSPVFLEMEPDDKLTSLDYIENGQGALNYFVAGRHESQAYIAELEFNTGGAVDYHEPDQNYCYGHTPGSGWSNDWDIVMDIEKYHGVNITNDLIYMTGRYESSGLFNSGLPAVSGDYDAFTGAMEVNNLADGFDFLGTGGNEYALQGGSYYRAQGNEIDYREINGHYQPIVIGNYEDGITNYGLPSTSAQLNTFIVYFEDFNTHMNYMYSASFEDNFVSGPNNYATGNGLIINPVEEKLYATGEFNSWTDLVALDQPTISIHQNEWVKNMWVAELDLEANFHWLAGGLAPTGTPLTHQSGQTPQGVRSNGVATVGKRAFVGGFANIQVDLEPSQTSGSIYASPTVPIAPVGIVNANLEMYTVRIGELSFAGGGVFHKKDPNTTSNEEIMIGATQFKTRMMPNPTSGRLRFELESGNNENWRISVFNTMGQQVIQMPEIISGNNSIEVNWSGLAAGMYLVKIDQGNQTETHRLIVR